MAASISVTLKMIDQMSQRLDDIANSGDRVANNFTQFGDKANAAFENATSGSQKISESMQAAATATSEYVEQGSKAEQALDGQAAMADKAAQEVGEFGNEAEEAGRQSEEFGEKASDSAMSLGNALVAAGIVVALKAIADAYNECDEAADQFETAMAKVSTIADTTAVSLDTIRGDIQKLSSETGVAVADLSESVYSAISASVDTANAVDFVAQANALAVGGFTQTSTAVDILTTALNAYQLEADQTQNVADMLIMTQNLGKTTVDELASSMGKVIPTAKSLNVDLDELCGAYSVMTANGIATAETTTYLNSMLNELGKYGSAAADAFAAGTEHIKAGGLTMAEAMESGWGLTDVLSILDEQAYATGTSISNMFGSAEAGKAANVLWGNAEKVDKNIEQMANSAGAATAAFEKMSDTGEFVEKKWQNATENLKIAIGDAQPSLDGLMTVGTEIVGKLTEFVQAHPQVVSAFESAALAAGVFTAGITAYTVASGLATKATAVLSGVMTTLSAHPAVMAVTAIAAVTAGLVALASTCDLADDMESKLTASSQELSDEIARQEDTVASLEEQYGATSEKTLEAKARLGELKAEFEATGETIGAYQERIQGMIQAAEDSISSYQETAKALGEERTNTQVLVAELERLQSQSELTAFQQEYEKQVVEKLNEAYPDLGLAYDSVSEKINKSTEYLKEYCEQKYEEAKLEAEVAAYVEQRMQYEELLAEQAKAQEDLNAATERYNEILAQDAANPWYKRGWNLGDKLADSRSEMQAAQEAVDSLTTEIDKLSAEMDSMDGSAKAAADSVDEVGNAASSVIDTTEGLKAAMQGVFDGVSEQAEELAEAYQQAYDAAASAVDGSFGMFEKVEQESSVSTQKMIEAWESQAKYLDEYASNLEKAKSLGLDAGLVENLADGSQESAAALDTIITKIEDLGASTDSAKKYISDMNDSFKSVQDAKRTLEDTMVEMNTGLQVKMEELKSTMESGIEGLNLSSEAECAAKDTISAYIAAIESMKGNAVDAAAGVSAAVEAALAGIKIPAYRSGQETGNGIISGIKSKTPEVKKSITDTANIMIDSYNKQLKINSPSKVFEESSGYIIDGIVVGVEQNQGRAATACEGLAEETVGRYSEKVAEAATATDHYLGFAVDAYSDYSDKAASAMDSVTVKLGGLSEAYLDNFESAHQSIDGKIGLFDDMEIGASKSIDEMMQSLKSQADYMEEYGSYMHRAMELGVDEGMLKKLSDGSQESAAILKEIVTNGSSRIDELNASFSKVEEGKNTFSAIMAEMETYYDGELDRMVGSLEEAVGNMDQYDAAYQSAEGICRGMIEGADSQWGAVIGKYADMGREAADALARSAGSSGKVSLGKHANGTTYGENVYIAGEYGPELIVGREGSEVFPASETAKILSAVMNSRDKGADVPMATQEVTTIIRGNEGSANSENRNLTLTIKGKGSLDIGQSVSRKDLMNFVRDELEGAIMSIISREVYEEGEVAYEF